MSEELMPCFFCECGEVRVIVVDDVTDAGCEEATVPLYAASCPYCGARGPMALSEDEAVAAWNRRAGRTCRMGAPIDGEYRCSECGHLQKETYRTDGGWHRPVYCAHCGARAVE